MAGLEAVQFGEWKPWHAIQPQTFLTFCGKDATTAQRQWERWDDYADIDKCTRCAKAVNQIAKIGHCGGDTCEAKVRYRIEVSTRPVFACGRHVSTMLGRVLVPGRTARVTELK